jgi:lipopolysaccharide transport system permease protein
MSNTSEITNTRLMPQADVEPGRLARVRVGAARRFDLVRTLATRELAARYRGSLLGVVWTVLTPIVMIAIYTFIFAGIFGARFGKQSDAAGWDYALYIFCGLLPWTAFAETLQTSATTILTHVNLVKRVVFPLATLPVSHACAAFVNQLCGTFVLLALALALRGRLHATVLWLPLLWMLQMLFVCGLSWFVAALGVFLRDTPQGLSLVLTAWLFLTPIIYPLAVVPESYRSYLAFNPWTPLVESHRRVILDGTAPDFAGLTYFAVVALLVFAGGYFWFARTRRGFADVI